MFVRFRQTQSRLQVSLVETRRVDGKVRHEHVASLGSVVLSATVADRIAFWVALHERLGKLSNRIASEALGKIMGDIHARVPMVTPDEQRALQLENAKADADQWAALHDMSAAAAADHENLVAKVSSKAATSKAAAAEAGAKAHTARRRVEAIQRGETVEGGLGKPEDFRAIIKAAGWTDADLRHARLLASVPKEHFAELVREDVRLQRKGDRRRSTRAARMILRKYGKS